MRNGKVFLIIGGRGVGKTTYLEKLLKDKKNVVVFQLFIDEHYKYADKRLYQDFNINKSLCNKTIVIEDATQLIGANPKNDIRKIVVSSKQMGSDIFFIFHSVNVVPPYLWQLFDLAAIFESAAPKKTTGLAEYFDEIDKILTKPRKKFKPLGILTAH